MLACWPAVLLAPWLVLWLGFSLAVGWSERDEQGPALALCTKVEPSRVQVPEVGEMHIVSPYGRAKMPYFKFGNYSQLATRPWRRELAPGELLPKGNYARSWRTVTPPGSSCASGPAFGQKDERFLGRRWKSQENRNGCGSNQMGSHFGW